MSDLGENGLILKLLWYNKKVKKEFIKSNKITKGFTPTPTFTKHETCVMKSHCKSGCGGFTLIELLVVIAIIGILSAVVVASLNSAREKGKIATIKSTLKQLYNQAALNQVENGSFIGSNDGSLNCTGTNNNLAKIVQPLIDQGVVAKCFSLYGTGIDSQYAGDDYLRFGATALIYDAGELKAWSVDENGVVKWDTHGVDLNGASVTPDTNSSMSWTVSKTACAKNGGRLPSIEQLRTLSYAWYSASLTYTGTGSRNPNPTLGTFIIPANYYWSSTPVLSNPTNLSNLQSMVSGNLTNTNQSNGYYARCVR